jgi:WD40 repeat protein
MNTRKKIIQWAPHNPSYFAVGSTDLRIYEIKGKNENKTPLRGIQQFIDAASENTSKKESKSISLFGVAADPQFQNLKCMAWSPEAVDNEPVVAIGLASGRVGLTRFSFSGSDQQNNANNTNITAPINTNTSTTATSTGNITKLFVPRHARACNALAWNHVHKNLVACGLEKVRSDYSCLIWDINQPGMIASEESDDAASKSGVLSNSAADVFNVMATSTVEKVERATREFANSEATVALAWLPSNPLCLATGTGTKWLRIYDLRAPYKAPKSAVAHSKAVYGVTFDPFHEDRLATFSEDAIIKIWDLRQLKDPILSLNTNSKGLVQIEWCPTRAGVLAVIGKEESSIRLWDIKDSYSQLNAASKDGVVEPAITEALTKPSRSYDTSDVVVSVGWSPFLDFKLAALTNGGAVEIAALHAPLGLSLGAPLSLAVADGRTVWEGVATPNGESDDISTTMRMRAELGYSADLKVNKDLSAKFKDDQLEYIWNWLYNVKHIYNWGRSGEIKGIYSIIHMSREPSKEEKGVFDRVVLFKSAERTFCEKLCGWGFSGDVQLEARLSQLEDEKQFEKAAALAVYHLDIKRAILSLNKAPNTEQAMNLKFIGMALAGFGTNPDRLWRETCQPFVEKLKVSNPYLSTVFGFLCSIGETNSYDNVLGEGSLISLSDKLAFANRFLDDERLKGYIERIKKRVIAEGNLQGLALTGVDSLGQGLDLLQNYLNNTADIQTVSLILSHISSRKVKDARVLKWVAVYRDMLDQWGLWKERAKLDVQRVPTLDSKPPAQVFARCNFCGQSLTLGRESRGAKSLAASKTRPGVTQFSTNKAQNNPAKISACPHCKKPLPKCSLCLLPFNVTPPDPRHHVASDGVTWHSGRNEFDDWITWCQNCKHGGHAKHIFEWFETHNECPVSDCHCNCVLYK